MYKLAEDIFFNKRKQDLSYLKYLLNHKYNLYNVGNTLGLPMSTKIKHDWSKFLPSIWEPHRDYFYGSSGIKGTNDRDTYLKYMDSRKLHFEKEPGHHNLDKSVEQELESVADWYAVSKANNPIYFTFPMWWNKYKSSFKYKLKPETIEIVSNAIIQE